MPGETPNPKAAKNRIKEQYDHAGVDIPGTVPFAFTWMSAAMATLISVPRHKITPF